MFTKLATTAALLSTTFAKVNEAYAQFISGETEISYEVFDSMWERYTQEVKSVSNADEATRK